MGVWACGACSASLVVRYAVGFYSGRAGPSAPASVSHLYIHLCLGGGQSCVGVWACGADPGPHHPAHLLISTFIY